MSMNMIHNDLTEEEIEQNTSRKHKDQNVLELPKNLDTKTGSIRQEYLEDTTIERHETMIEHTLWQTSVQEFEINVEATDAVEVNTQQETRIRTIPNGAVFSNYIENFIENQYICKICYDSFDYFDEFLFHKNVMHNSKPYVCNVCDTQFTLRVHLYEHQSKHDNRPRMRNSSVVSRGQLAVNSEENVFPNVNVNKSYKCKDCNRDFTTRTELNIHYKQHKQQMICSTCHKTFVLKRNFEKHLLSHTNVIMSNDISNNTSQKQQEVIGSVKHNLNTLNAQTKTIKRIESEKQNISLNEKVFQCLSCNKFYRSRGSLGQHNRHNHSRTELTDRKLNSGTVVTKKSNDNSEKQNISLNEKVFQCLSCNKFYRSKSSLGQHNRHNHSRTELTDRKLNSGTVVTKKSNDNSEKQKVSLNLKLFQCLRCNKYFKSKRSLGQHKRQNHSRTKSPVGKLKSLTVVSK